MPKFIFYWEVFVDAKTAGDIIARVDNFIKRKKKGYYDHEVLQFIRDTFPTVEEAIIAAYHAGKVIQTFDLIQAPGMEYGILEEIRTVPSDLNRAIEQAQKAFSDYLREQRDKERRDVV